SFLTSSLGLPDTLPATLRYQLLHRLASALLLARHFNAHYAIMLVHSFSSTNRWFQEFEEFCRLFPEYSGRSGLNSLLNEIDGISLFAGWARGNAAFLH